jgi:hypothetical protein
MRTFVSFLAAGIFAVLVGCGSSSSNGGSGSGRTGSNGGLCPGSSKGQTCTGEAEYASCTVAACRAEYEACYGSNFASGNFTGSTCADLMACQLKCPCDATATTCESSCRSQYAPLGSACLSALGALTVCVAANTAPTGTCVSAVCTGGTPTATGCAAALQCCQALAAAYGESAVQQCAAMLAGQTDEACNQLITTYKALCP